MRDKKTNRGGGSLYSRRRYPQPLSSHPNGVAGTIARFFGMKAPVTDGAAGPMPGSGMKLSSEFE
jgi:hypothetical protein